MNPFSFLKEIFRKRFNQVITQNAPSVTIPRSPKDALDVGYRLGLRDGYGAGMIDGVELGLDVSTKAMVSPAIIMDPSEFN